MLKKVLCFVLVIGLLTGGYGMSPARVYAEFDTGVKPLNLVLSDYSTYSAQETLTWSAVTGAAGYVVYVNDSEKKRVDTTSYEIPDLAPYTAYSIYVKAYDATGNLSEASDTLNITTSYVIVRNVGAGQTYTTIKAATNVMNPGDVVLIKDGTYTAADISTITRSGTSGQWITIMAEDDDPLIQAKMVINANYIRLAGLRMDAYVSGTYLSGRAVDILKDYTQIANMDIRNYAFGIYYQHYAGYAYVADNYFYKCAEAILTGGNSTFERNEIEYLDLNGRSGDADYFRVFGNNVIIRNNYTHGTVAGSHLGSAHVDYVQSYDNDRTEVKNILIENNRFSGLAHEGFMLANYYYPSSTYLSDWTIRNNIFQGFVSWGINAINIPDMTIENNLFMGDPAANGGVGSYFGIVLRDSYCTGVIRNNIIMNISDVGYKAITGAAITENGHNVIYNAGDPCLDITDILEDPLLVDPANGNFHLQLGSRAIDEGAAISFLYDMEKNVRPCGNGIDIGPYELVPVESVDITESDITIEVGNTHLFEVTVLPGNATHKALIWESSAPSVATVDANGTVTAVSVGSATITARATGTTIEDTCAVTVSNLPAPLAEYTFLGNMNDTSGNGYNGSSRNSPSLTEDREQNQNSAYDFTSGQYIDLGDSDDFIGFGANNFTAVLRFKADECTSTGQLIGKTNDPYYIASPGQGFFIGLREISGVDRLIAQIRGATGGREFSIPIDETQWHFVAFVKDTGGVYLYLDGVAYPFTVTVGDSSCTNIMRLGKDGTTGQSPYSGVIDDVRIYDEALTEEQLDMLYTMGI